MNILLNFLEDGMKKEDIDETALFTVKDAIDLLNEQLDTEIVSTLEDRQDISTDLINASKFIANNKIYGIYIEGFINKEYNNKEAWEILENYKKFLGV